MKLHEIKSQISNVTGLTVLDNDVGLSVLVTGDHTEMVAPTEAKLREAKIPFKKEKNRKFKGALFIIPLINVGTVWNANWDYAK